MGGPAEGPRLAKNWKMLRAHGILAAYNCRIAYDPCQVPMSDEKSDAVKDAGDRQLPAELLQRLHEATQRLHSARQGRESADDLVENDHQKRVDLAGGELNAAEKAVEEITMEIQKAMQTRRDNHHPADADKHA